MQSTMGDKTQLSSRYGLDLMPVGESTTATAAAGGSAAPRGHPASYIPSASLVAARGNADMEHKNPIMRASDLVNSKIREAEKASDSQNRRQIQIRRDLMAAKQRREHEAAAAAAAAARKSKANSKKKSRSKTNASKKATSTTKKKTKRPKPKTASTEAASSVQQRTVGKYKKNLNRQARPYTPGDFPLPGEGGRRGEGGSAPPAPPGPPAHPAPPFDWRTELQLRAQLAVRGKTAQSVNRAHVEQLQKYFRNTITIASVMGEIRDMLKSRSITFHHQSRRLRPDVQEILQTYWTTTFLDSMIRDLLLFGLFMYTLVEDAVLIQRPLCLSFDLFYPVMYIDDDGQYYWEVRCRANDQVRPNGRVIVLHAPDANGDLTAPLVAILEMVDLAQFNRQAYMHGIARQLEPVYVAERHLPTLKPPNPNQMQTRPDGSTATMASLQGTLSSNAPANKMPYAGVEGQNMYANEHLLAEMPNSSENRSAAFDFLKGLTESRITTMQHTLNVAGAPTTADGLRKMLDSVMTERSYQALPIDPSLGSGKLMQMSDYWRLTLLNSPAVVVDYASSDQQLKHQIHQAFKMPELHSLGNSHATEANAVLAMDKRRSTVTVLAREINRYCNQMLSDIYSVADAQSASLAHMFGTPVYEVLQRQQRQTNHGLIQPIVDSWCEDAPMQDESDSNDDDNGMDSDDSSCTSCSSASSSSSSSSSLPSASSSSPSSGRSITRLPFAEDDLDLSRHSPHHVRMRLKRWLRALEHKRRPDGSYNPMVAVIREQIDQLKRLEKKHAKHLARKAEARKQRRHGGGGGAGASATGKRGDTIPSAKRARLDPTAASSSAAAAGTHATQGMHSGSDAFHPHEQTMMHDHMDEKDGLVSVNAAGVRVRVGQQVGRQVGQQVGQRPHTPPGSAKAVGQRPHTPPGSAKAVGQRPHTPPGSAKAHTAASTTDKTKTTTKHTKTVTTTVEAPSSSGGAANHHKAAASGPHARTRKPKRKRTATAGKDATEQSTEFESSESEKDGDGLGDGATSANDDDDDDSDSHVSDDADDLHDPTSSSAMAFNRMLKGLQKESKAWTKMFEKHESLQADDDALEDGEDPTNDPTHVASTIFMKIGYVDHALGSDDPFAILQNIKHGDSANGIPGTQQDFDDIQAGRRRHHGDASTASSYSSSSSASSSSSSSSDSSDTSSSDDSSGDDGVADADGHHHRHHHHSHRSHRHLHGKKSKHLKLVPPGSLHPRFREGPADGSSFRQNMRAAERIDMNKRNVVENLARERAIRTQLARTYRPEQIHDAAESMLAENKSLEIDGSADITVTEDGGPSPPDPIPDEMVDQASREAEAAEAAATNAAGAHATAAADAANVEARNATGPQSDSDDDAEDAASGDESKSGAGDGDASAAEKEGGDAEEDETDEAKAKRKKREKKERKAARRARKQHDVDHTNLSKHERELARLRARNRVQETELRGHQLAEAAKKRAAIAAEEASKHKEIARTAVKKHKAMVAHNKRYADFHAKYPYAAENAALSHMRTTRYGTQGAKKRIRIAMGSDTSLDPIRIYKYK